MLPYSSFLSDFSTIARLVINAGSCVLFCFCRLSAWLELNCGVTRSPLQSFVDVCGLRLHGCLRCSRPRLFATATIVRELCKSYDYRIETEFQLTLPCSSSQFFLSSIRHSTISRPVRELALSTVNVVSRTNLQRKYVKGQAALSSGWK